MATAHYVVPAAPVVTPVVSSEQDIELAHRAADLLVTLTPARDIEKTVIELIARMRAEKIMRGAIGHNNWSEHAPKFLALIVREERQVRLRRLQALEDFRRAYHAKVLTYAYAAFKDRNEAEDVVSQTYIEFLEGRTDEKKFMRALKMNIVDRQRRQVKESEKLQTIEEAFESRESSGEDGEGDEATCEPISPRLEDQDPLDILIMREDFTEKRRQTRRAKKIAQTDWRYCWIGQKNWGRELGITTSRTAKP